MDEILESLSLEDLLNLENIVITPQEKVESRQDTQITFNVYNTDLLELIIANSDVDIRGYSPRTYVLRTSGKKLNIGVLIRSLDTGEPLLAMDPYLECQKQKNLPTYVGRFF
ncbi:MAG: hypothetical protein COA99_04345 [Moraxellaceae bacterium]|nr:MAG: hypothetical protein COA99_04345 [Moraxellaceae bacterium]